MRSAAGLIQIMPTNGTGPGCALHGNCAERVLRGGSYLVAWRNIGVTRRDHNSRSIRGNRCGFRVLRAM
jgi:hypothetical protein